MYAVLKNKKTSQVLETCEVFFVTIYEHDV